MGGRELVITRKRAAGRFEKRQRRKCGLASHQKRVHGGVLTPVHFLLRLFASGKQLDLKIRKRKMRKAKGVRKWAKMEVFALSGRLAVVLTSWCAALSYVAQRKTCARRRRRTKTDERKPARSHIGLVYAFFWRTHTAFYIRYIFQLDEYVFR